MYKKYKELISDITETLKENKGEIVQYESELYLKKIAEKIINKIEENNVIVFGKENSK